MSPSRSQAEPPPDEALRFERLLADLSSRFVNLPPSEVDQQIEQSLQQIEDEKRLLQAQRNNKVNE